MSLGYRSRIILADWLLRLEELLLMNSGYNVMLLLCPVDQLHLSNHIRPMTRRREKEDSPAKGHYPVPAPPLIS
jgi:hypothetical protein